MAERKAAFGLEVTAGVSGTGRRMSIRHARTLLNAALSGALAGAKFHPDRVFGLMIPDAVEGVPTEVLDPREAWADKAAYDRQAAELIGRFEQNFERFAESVDDEIRNAAIRSAA